MAEQATFLPLSGIVVVANASGVAATYAARLLGTMGARVVLVEGEGGSPLRRDPPFLPNAQADTAPVAPGSANPDPNENDTGTSALFAYLAAGMESLADSLDSPAGEALLASADILIDDSPVGTGPDSDDIACRFPNLVHVCVLPFGASGPKAAWKGEDINIQHAGGEGYLLPNGLATELFPDRPPLKIGGHFGEMQGGVAAALGALSALWARPDAGGQFVDVSCQDANLAVGAFAIQRLGDGSVEHRVQRSFRYGGVIACADGYLEMLTLEQRQWDGMVKLLGEPEWAMDPALSDPLERGRRGPEINAHIRQWASSRNVDDIVAAGQNLGVPLARYKTPAEILDDPHEKIRGLFQEVSVGRAGMLPVLVSPFHFDGRPLALVAGPPELSRETVKAGE